MYFLVAIVFLFFTLGILIGKSLSKMDTKGKIIFEYDEPYVVCDYRDIRNEKTALFEIVVK